MNKQFEMVKLFHECFGHPVAVTPKALPLSRAMARYDWMIEECNEFLEADSIYDQVDAMIDLMYFALGCLVEIGIKPDKVFNIVQKANMAKLWEDGIPHYREDGKVVKPEGWEPPEPKIKEYIDRMIGKC